MGRVFREGFMASSPSFLYIFFASALALDSHFFDDTRAFGHGRIGLGAMLGETRKSMRTIARFFSLALGLLLPDCSCVN